jgi:uncharacterized membrane protein
MNKIFISKSIIFFIFLLMNCMIAEINVEENKIDLTDAKETADKNKSDEDENKKTCKKEKDNDENDITAL